MSLLKDLNESQREGVTETDGRVLILAGAGSGKTRVLTYRMAYLIQNRGVPPAQILGLTFTNKAAAEMRHRLAGLVGKQKNFLGTFHSFCMTVLREDIAKVGFTSEFTLYSQREVERVAKQVARDILEHDGDLPSVEPLLHKLSFAKNQGVPFTTDDTFLQELVQKLTITLRAYNALDFDDLLYYTLELFKIPEVLEKYQERFRYIMIDEYQDTNPVQNKIANLLAEKHGNLCVVGDDDQSIYRWRGAEVKQILHFPADKVIKLEQNYRSSPFILQAANSVIHNNQMRHRKKLWCADDQGEKISLFHAPTEKEEADAIVARMIALKTKKNIPWRECAILYRSNILSRSFEVALRQAIWEDKGEWVRGIPYQVFGGTEFFERSEVKDLMSYLRIIANPLDHEALLRIINVPRRGISDNTLEQLVLQARNEKIPLWTLMKGVKYNLPVKASASIASFVQLVDHARVEFEKGPLHVAFRSFIDKMNYKKAIEEDVKSDKVREFKWENVEECIDTLAAFEESGGKNLSLFLNETLLEDDQWQKKEKNVKEDKVSLMTFHNSKGLEFTACFLSALEDHLLPHEKSIGDAGLEEERRLFYVAITRARKYLTLSMVHKRKKMGKETLCSPSRFLHEIPQDLLNITSWQDLP